MTVIASLFFASCGGGGGSGALTAPAPTQTAAAPTAPILVFDTQGYQVLALQISGTGPSYAQSVTVSQLGYAAAFTASGCGGIASSSMASAVLTVTGNTAGTCTLTIGNAYAQTVSLPLSVTTTSAGIH